MATDSSIPARFAIGAAVSCAVSFSHAAELPVPCVAGSCGAAVGFVSNGVASATQAGNTLTVNQSSDSATLNWRSFNIGQDGTVRFVQPGADSVALNQIHQDDPSRIFGALNANGRVFLLNQNGFLFGAQSRVDVGGLVASSLQITETAVQNGVAQAIRERQPAFAAQGANPAGGISIEAGATITANAGQVLVFAPEVVNAGEIRTPDGQTILAAGNRVYLLASQDANLRGLLVEVDTGTQPASVTNVGQIIAERGNVTLAGLAVNQQGRISATTSTRFNGSIHLQARDSVDTTVGTASNPVLRTLRGGVLTLGEGSRTEVTLDATDTSTAVDVNAQPRSQVLLDGDQVRILEDSRVTATAGNIQITAERNPRFPVTQTDQRSDSRIYIAAGARLDVSGASTELPMESNVVEAQLRANEVRDSPEQRDSVLRGESVYVDIRRSGVLADGTPWQGTPVADVSGAIAAQQRGLAERNLAGGTIRILSQGDVVIAPGAQIDVSGGAVRYQDGFVKTTQVLSNGEILDISRADPDRPYQAILKDFALTDSVWGVTRSFPGFFSPGTFEQGYVEGRDAGSVTVLGHGLVLDGSFIGKAGAGDFQRRPNSPRAGLLTIGRESLGGVTALRLTPDLYFGDEAVWPGLTDGQGGAFDPLTSPLPAGVARVSLSPKVLGRDAMGSLAIFSDGRIEVGRDVDVSPLPGGQLVLSGREVDFDGTVVSPGASIALVNNRVGVAADTDAVRLGSHARIDVSGQWVNDNETLLGAARPAALTINGGDVRIEAVSGNLLLEAGGVVDVSAGAQRARNGRVVAGRAGSVTISNTPTEGSIDPGTVTLGSELRGYSLQRGGTLALRARELCISSLTCGGDLALALTPEFFSDGGFSSYSLTSLLGDLSVLPGTVIAPRQRSWELNGDTALLPTGTALASFMRLAELPDLLRPPVDISLRVAARGPWGVLQFNQLPWLDFGAGAALSLDPGASVSLQSNTRMRVDGQIIAPAGRISLTLDNGLNLLDFDPGQAIWLGSQAALRAPGVVRTEIGDAGLLRGAILGGGTVELRANRGYLFLDQGSLIDVSGVQGLLDVPASFGGVNFSRRTVASDGGAINLFAAEGAQVHGGLFAQAGGAGARGGSFRLDLDAGSRSDVVFTDEFGEGVSLFPGGSRTLELTQSRQPVAIQAGAAVPSFLNGIGRIAAETLHDGGFFDVSLSARNLRGPAALRSVGRLSVGSDVDLRIPGRLTVDVARVESSGGAALNLTAGSALSVGSSDRLSQDVTLLPAQGQAAVPAVLSGTGSVRLSGGLVELVGNVAFSGAAQTRIESATDIRARGVQLAGQGSVEGDLTASGNLTLQAEQVYPATLSRYRVALPLAGSVLRVESPQDAAPVAPLSAGGQLELAAEHIINSGNITAPFGTVRMQAGDIQLAAGSRVSVSGAGSAVPFGNTQGGFDWVYQLNDQRTLVYGVNADQTPLPERQVVLEGDRIDNAAGSVIDVSAGGQLLASEFLPGVGGTRDILAAVVSPRSFAIVPALGADYAPYDQAMYEGSSIRPGDTITLAAGSAVPAGTYAVLPARYALLPGAFLVAAVDGYQDIAAGQVIGQRDGSVVIAGQRGVAGTDVRDARTSGFLVRDGASVRRIANYTTTSAADFFRAQAQAAEVAAPRLPEDSGRVSLSARESLTLEGQLAAAPLASGRGAELDISSAHIRVTADASSPAAGELLILDDSLNRLGAESILLGGLRRGQNVDVSAQSVTIGEGASLRVGELLAAARETLTFESGSEVVASGDESSGNGTGEIKVTGDGALARISRNGLAEVSRTGSTGTAGVLEVQSGARLAASGSLTLESARRSVVEGTLSVAGAAAAFIAPTIEIGVAAPPDAGLWLTPEQIESLGVHELVLQSRSTLGMGGEVDLSLERLTVKAGAILARGADADIRIDAQNARLIGAGTAVSDVSTNPAGSFALHTQSATIGPGNLLIGGFNAAAVTATGDITLDNAALRSSGDLQLQASRLVGTTGSTSSATAGGGLSLTRSSAAADATGAALGARIDLAGRSVHVDGRVDLPSGQFNIAAGGGDAVIGADADIRMAGVVATFDGVEIGSGGGAMTIASRSGDARIAAGARIDVSGSRAGGEGGRLDIAAPEGQVQVEGELRGSAAAGERGATFTADAGQLPDLLALNRRLNAGGFTAQRGFRQRGAGDLVLAGSGDAAARAARVGVTADQGGILVSGQIATTGDAKSSVVLNASGNVTVTGTIDASATPDGVVSLQSAGGGVLLQPGSTVRLQDGDLRLRLPRTSVLTVTDADPANDQLRLAGTIEGARRVDIEGVAVYADADGTLTAAEVAAQGSNIRYAEAQGFAANAAQIRAGLGHAQDESLHLLSGIEIRSAGDLRLAADWNLSGWRFGGEPGVLTLRAAGDLTIDANLSDGFSAVTGNNAFLLPTTAGDSWSYRLVAGSDLASADPLGLLAPDRLAASKGTFRIGTGTAAAPRFVRTGTGFIDVAAGRDFILGNALAQPTSANNRFSVLYTAGAASGGLLLSGLGQREYADNGGDISIRVQRDLHGALTNQLVTDWLWRSGRPAGVAPAATGWTVNFQRFEQGIGALGGGDVTLDVGGDVRNLSVSIPSIGRQVGGTDPDLNAVELAGGGNLSVGAGGTLTGGSYYIGLGTGRIQANAFAQSSAGFYPVLALGDATMKLTTRLDLGIDAIVNPTLVRQGSSQGVVTQRSFFSTYGADSGASLLSVAGTAHIGGNPQSLAASLSSIPFSGGLEDQRQALRLYAPQLRVAALSGDVNVRSGFTLFPSARGNLELFAENNVLLAPVASPTAEIIVSDVDPAFFPSVGRPAITFDGPDDVIRTTLTTLPAFHAPVPVHAATSGTADFVPVRFVARNGDIRSVAPIDAIPPPLLSTPKAARISAGRDIVDFTLHGQNLVDTDVTSLIAGRDIRYTTQRDALGNIRSSERQISLAGPGTLEIVAGRNVDLQTARGIETTGDLFNPALPDTGASVSIAAGLAGGSPRLADFIARYFEGGTTYDAELLAYAARLAGHPVATKSEALAILREAGESQQAVLVQAAFLNEIRESGRTAAHAGNTDFRRAFTAIETLFPGSNPDLEDGEQNPYVGDLALYFSRVYTLDGGDITLLAPGGEINVGLATPPTAFGISKKPEMLGVVAQSSGSVNAFSFGDFLVNESRVFAADGGNILVWSTRGDIDAGRGSKTAISAPPPVVTIDAEGRTVITFPAALAGSGIQTLATSAGSKPGNVDLFAPRGVVNASDAGIVAGNLTIAATAVLGASNISVSGSSVGVPVDTSALSGSVSAASGSAAGAASAAESALAPAASGSEAAPAPLAGAALNWLEVFVEGFGEEVCKLNDEQCLQRNRRQPE